MKRHSIEEGNELPACRVKSSLSTTKRQRDVVLPAASVGNAPVWKQNAQAERIDKPQNSQKSATLRPGSSNPTQVLLVRVSDITHPVTIGALHTIFSRLEKKMSCILILDSNSTISLCCYPTRYHRMPLLLLASR